MTEISTELALAYVQGATLAELRERTGLSRRAVRRHVIDGGAALRPIGEALVVTPPTLAAEYNAGATLRELATRYATSVPTILKRLTADPGYTPRPRRPPLRVRSPKRVDVELANQLADEYTGGASLEELRDRHELPYRQVREHVIAAGATMRPAIRRGNFTAPRTLANDYTAGASIRQLAEKHDVSYGVMRRRLIADPDVTLRDQGPHGRVP